MKVPVAQYSPPFPVLIVAAVAALILLVLIAQTLTDLLLALIQLGVILAALGATLWMVAYLLRRVKP